MARLRSLQFYLFIAVLGLVTLFEYGDAFRFYFVGDDFDFIDYVLKGRIRIFWETPVNWHYCPLGVLLITLPAWFGSLEPAWFVLIGYIFFLATLVLIMILVREIGGNLLGGFLAALIYSTAIPNSEVIYWKTGNTTIAMTFFALLALLLFMRYRKSRSRKTLAGCAIAIALSMLCIEQGIVIYGILLLYDAIFWTMPELRAAQNEKKRIALDILRRHAILLSAPILLTALKVGLGIRLSPFPISSRPFWVLLEPLTLSPARLVDFNQVIFPFVDSTWTFRLVGFFILLALLIYTLLRRNMAGLFLLLSSVGSILAITLAAGAILPRYFCLPLAFFSCLLSLIIGDAATALAGAFTRTLPNGAKPGKRERAAESLAFATNVIVCCAIAVVGLRGNLVRRDYWRMASQIERNVATEAEMWSSSRCTQNSPDKKIYLLNVPYYIFLEKSLETFPVARNSLENDLRCRLGEAACFIEPIATANCLDAMMGGKRVTYRVYGWKNPVTKPDITRILREGHLVLQFSPATMTLVSLS